MRRKGKRARRGAGKELTEHPSQGVSLFGNPAHWNSSCTAKETMPCGAVPVVCLIASGNGTRRENHGDGVVGFFLWCSAGHTRWVAMGDDAYVQVPTTW